MHTSSLGLEIRFLFLNALKIDGKGEIANPKVDLDIFEADFPKLPTFSGRGEWYRSKANCMKNITVWEFFASIHKRLHASQKTSLIKRVGHPLE